MIDGDTAELIRDCFDRKHLLWFSDRDDSLRVACTAVTEGEIADFTSNTRYDLVKIQANKDGSFTMHFEIYPKGKEN